MYCNRRAAAPSKSGQTPGLQLDSSSPLPRGALQSQLQKLLVGKNKKKKNQLAVTDVLASVALEFEQEPVEALGSNLMAALDLHSDPVDAYSKPLTNALQSKVSIDEVTRAERPGKLSRSLAQAKRPGKVPQVSIDEVVASYDFLFEQLFSQQQAESEAPRTESWVTEHL